MNTRHGSAQTGEGKRGGAIAPSGRRSWTISVVWAAISVGVAILLSATINPLIGRRVHWDWTSALAVALFTLVTVALRRRWV